MVAAKIAIYDRLASHYAALLCCLIVSAVQSLVLWRLAGDRALYIEAWRIIQVASWASQCWLVIDIFRRWTGRYPAVGRFGLNLLIAVLAVALIAGVCVGWHSYGFLLWVGNIRAEYVLRSFQSAAMAAFMVVTAWLFLRFYRPSAPPNLIHHTYVSLALFLALVSRGVLEALRVVPEAYLQFAFLVIHIGCYASWGILLTKNGEVAQRASVDPEAERALADLDRELTAGIRAMGVGRRLRSWLS